MEPIFNYCFHMSLSTRPYSGPGKSSYILTSYLFKIHINIILLSTDVSHLGFFPSLMSMFMSTCTFKILAITAFLHRIKLL